MKRPYQVAWWDHPVVDFNLRNPWWWAESRTLNIGDNRTVRQYRINAAVMATSPEDAMSQIVGAYDCDVELQWLFIKEQPLGWSPYSEQRPEKPGMIWDQRPH